MMEYDNIEFDELRTDYFREMQLLSEIMKNINKVNRMESKLEELFSEISKYNRGKEILHNLQNTFSKRNISMGNERVSNDESSYIPKELSEIENIMERNKTNFREAINLIRKARYHEGWRQSIIYDKEFLELAGIPIYLPGIFPDIISAEFLLHILYGNEIIFVPKDSDMPNDHGFGVYQRQAHRAINKAGQIEVDMNIVFANKKRGKDNNANVWDLVNIYSYIDILDRSDEHIRKQTFNGTRSIKGILNQLQEDLFYVFQMPQMNNNLKKIVLFRTIIFQNLTDNERIRIFGYELIFKIGAWIYNNYLTNILWFPILTIRFITESSERYKERYDLMWVYIHELQKCYGHETEIRQNPYVVDDKNFWANIFSKLLEKRHEAYYTTALRKGLLATPWTDLDENQRTAYQALITQDEIGIATRQKFYNKYQDKINMLFSDRKEFDKCWDLSVKALLYLYPRRFSFPMGSKYVKKNLRDWFKLTKTTPCETSKDYSEIRNEQRRIKQVMHAMEGIRQDEIFPLMLMIAGAIRANAKSESGNNSDDMRRIQFIHDLDNIGNRYSPSLIESLRFIYEAHLQIGIVREQEVRWRLEMWRIFKDGMQSANDMESEAKQIYCFCDLLNNTFEIVMNILNRMQNY